MRRATQSLTLAIALLALAACGRSDKASDPATADNVEMPAEETMSGLDSSAVPRPDASAAATGGADTSADASAAAADSAATADGDADAAPSASPTPAKPIKM